MIKPITNPLIRYLLKFKRIIQLELLLKIILYFITFFLLGITIVWIINLISISQEVDYLEENILLILGIPIITTIILFGKDIYRIFLQKSLWGEIAELYENRKYCSGEVISSADYLEHTYNHYKSLEKIFIEKTYNKLQNIPISSLFQKRFLLKPSVTLGIIVFILFICSLTFSYTPIDTLKSSLFNNKSGIHFNIDFSQKIQFGHNFHLDLYSTSDKATLVMNYGHTSKKYYLQKKVFDKSKPVFHFQHNIIKINHSFSFYIILGIKSHFVKTPTYNVKVFQLPRISSIKTTVIYPEIYNYPSKNQSGGDIEGFEGSTVKLEIISNNLLKNLQLQFIEPENEMNSIENNIQNMNIQSNKAYTEFKINGSQSGYTITMIDKDDNQSEPIKYTISLLNDQPPSVKIIRPGPIVSLRNLNKSYPVYIEASDDFMVAQLILYYSVKSGHKIISNGYIPVQIKPDSTIQGIISIPFQKLILKPGNHIEYHVRAIDNRGQYQNSFPIQRFIYLKPDEIFLDIDKIKQNLISKVEDILGEYKHLSNKYNDIYKKDSSNTISQEETDKQLKSLEESEESIKSRLKQTIQDIHNLQHSMVNQNLVSMSELNNQLQDIKKSLLETLNNMENTKYNYYQHLTQKLLHDLNISQNLKEIIEKYEHIKQMESERKNKSPMNKDSKGIDINQRKSNLKSDINKAIKELNKLKSSTDKTNSPKHTQNIQKKLKYLDKLLKNLYKNQNSKEFKELQNYLNQLQSSETMFTSKNENYNTKDLQSIIKDLQNLKKLRTLLEIKSKVKQIIKYQRAFNYKASKSNSIIPLKKDFNHINNTYKNISKLLNNLSINNNKSSNFKIELNTNSNISTTTKNLNNQINNDLKYLSKSIDNDNKQSADKMGNKLINSFNQLEKMIQNKITKFKQQKKSEIIRFLRNTLLELIELRKIEGNKTKKIFIQSETYATEEMIQSQKSTKKINNLIKSTQSTKKFLDIKKIEFQDKLYKVIDKKSMYEIISLFDHILKSLDNTSKNISANEFYFAYKNQEIILTKLNLLTLKVMKLKTSSQSFGSTSSLSSGIPQKSFKAIQNLNKEIQQFINDMKSKKLSPRERNSLNNLSHKQENLKKIFNDLINNKDLNNYNSKKMLNSFMNLKRQLEEMKINSKNNKLNKILAKQKSLLQKLEETATKTIKQSKGKSIQFSLDKNDFKSSRPIKLFREKNQINAENYLKTILKRNDLKKSINMNTLNPKQKMIIQNYLNKMKNYSKNDKYEETE